MRKPKKTLASRSGVLSLVNKKEIKSKRKGTKTAPRPKYFYKKILISVPIGP